jgi:hypothetical protein
VLEVIVDGFNEAIGEFLHFALHIVQLIPGQRSAEEWQVTNPTPSLIVPAANALRYTI